MSSQYSSNSIKFTTSSVLFTHQIVLIFIQFYQMNLRTPGTSLLQDAEEFLSCMLDGMHEEMLACMRVHKGETAKGAC
jgi:ubiquitin C-terminal hydrolase